MAVQTITYDDKVYINENADIPAINKVTDDDMNEIKSVVNSNADNVGDLSDLETSDTSSIVNAINELKNGEVYSTSEVKTNKVWIDGNPIYRIVVYATDLATAAQFSTGITDRDVWTDFRFVVSAGDESGDVYTSNYYYSSSSYIRAFLSYSDTEIRWRSGTSGMYAYFILEYTKTTD